MKYVQFSDESETGIIAVFGCVQDPATHQNLGELADDDERFLAYVASIPEEFRAPVLSM